MKKDEAIREAGEKAIQEINNDSPDFTNRVMNTDFVEFSATAEYADRFGDKAVIAGYWYFTKKDIDEIDSLDLLDWGEAEDYEIVG